MVLTNDDFFNAFIGGADLVIPDTLPDDDEYSKDNIEHLFR